MLNLCHFLVVYYQLADQIQISFKARQDISSSYTFLNYTCGIQNYKVEYLSIGLIIWSMMCTFSIL